MGGQLANTRTLSSNEIYRVQVLLIANMFVGIWVYRIWPWKMSPFEDIFPIEYADVPFYFHSIHSILVYWRVLQITQWYSGIPRVINEFVGPSFTKRSTVSCLNLQLRCFPRVPLVGNELYRGWKKPYHLMVWVHPRKLTWLTGKSPFSIGNTSSFMVDVPLSC